MLLKISLSIVFAAALLVFYFGKSIAEKLFPEKINAGFILKAGGGAVAIAAAVLAVFV